MSWHGSQEAIGSLARINDAIEKEAKEKQKSATNDCRIDTHTSTPPHGDPLKDMISPSVCIYRFSIAYHNDVDARYRVLRDINLLRPRKILDASITLEVYGIGNWDTERCFIVETATPHRQAVTEWIILLLSWCDQQCAYLSVNGHAAYEVNRSGTWTPITGMPVETPQQNQTQRVLGFKGAPVEDAENWRKLGDQNG
jgi:hypothetical protein